jgi:FKBP-type peptidyl-prolyl cis-trans isomerase
MNKKNMIWVWALIVVLVVGGGVYLTINNNKSSMTQEDMGAQVGDKVSMNYTGKLDDGTVFDSNIDPQFNHVRPFEFTLGAGQVIPGWDKGIVGMKVGDKKTLVIPPEEGYGANGVGGIIPPNATLTFDVEVVNITKGVTNNQE